MGGGDLNLKKSWHPSTLRNIERVWKAEQKHEAEKQKIEQLQKELAEERAREEIQQFAEDQGVIRKKEEKLDWMYQGPASMVNREEYLLGRKVDKTFETLQMIEKGGESYKDEGAEDRSMFSCQNLAGTATVDLENKIREDPLFNIMKKEREERKNLLTNPVRMKQLQQLLKASLGKKSKKSKKKSHGSDSEEKKQRKKHRNAVSESDDETTSKKIKNNSKCKLPKRDSHFSERKKSKHEYEEPPVSERSHKCYPVPTSERNAYDRHDQNRPHSPMDFRESYQHSSREPYHYSRESFKTSSRQSGFQASKHLSYRERYSFKKHPNDSTSHNHNEDHRTKEENKRKLNKEEKERLLLEMQENAVWRDEQRKRKTQKYKEEDEEEERNRIETSDFLKPMLSIAAGKGNLQNRIKQKIFTIQRSSRDMDRNFARRN